MPTPESSGPSGYEYICRSCHYGHSLGERRTDDGLSHEGYVRTVCPLCGEPTAFKPGHRFPRQVHIDAEHAVYHKRWSKAAA